MILCLKLSAQEDVSSAKWVSNKIIVDGNNVDWNEPMNLFDDQTGLLFGISNDDKNLYLCFTGKDEMKIRKMMRSGWTIELSSKEKKKKFDVTLSFPAIHNMNKEKGEGVSAINKYSDFKGQVNLYRVQFSQVTAKGFKTKNGEIPLINPDGVNIGIGSDSIQKIIYEIGIPIKELMAIDDIKLNEQMELKVIVNAMEKPANSHSGERGEGRGFSNDGGGGGGRSRMGGGMGNGGGRMGGGRQGGDNSGQSQGGSNQDKTALFEKASFTQKIKLVNK